LIRFENLITRFEEPDSRNRWDSPLFTLLPDDNIEDFAQNIVDALILRKAPPPNLSTISVNIIYQLLLIIIYLFLLLFKNWYKYIR